MPVREIHLIYQGNAIVYTSLLECMRTTIFIESGNKQICIAYNNLVIACLQIDSFAIKELEQVIKYYQYTPGFDKDIYVLNLN